MSQNLSATTPAAPGGNTNVTWQADGLGNISGYVPTGGGGTPGGSNTEIQYNNSGAFGGAVGLTWTSGSSLLTVPNLSLSGTFKDGTGAVGTSGQVLSSTVTGTQWVTVTSSGGTVTSFSAGTLSPLFTTSVATATTTPALSFTLSTQSANLVFAGPTSGGAVAPTFRSLVTGDIPATLNSKTMGVNVTVSGTLTDSLGSVGSNGDVLSSTVTGTKWITASSGSGTVTSFSAGNASPLFTTSVATATTTPALTFSMTAQAANTFYAGPTSGGSVAPTFRTLAVNDFNSGAGASGTTFWRGDGTWATPGAGTGLANRSTVTTTYTSLAAGATDSTTNVTLFKSFELQGITITGSKKARVRLYSTAAARTADISRGYSVPLVLGAQHGCICDFYFDQVYAVTPWVCSPSIFGANADGSPVTTIYASVTNIDSTTQTIPVVYTVVQLEN